MQRRALLGCAAAIVIPTASASQFEKREETLVKEQRKPIVIYFSRAGMNYWSGEIVELKVGNTALLAQEIAKQTRAELLEIVPRAAYPFEYRATTDLAQKELNEQARCQVARSIDTGSALKIDTPEISF